MDHAPYRVLGLHHSRRSYDVGFLYWVRRCEPVGETEGRRRWMIHRDDIAIFDGMTRQVFLDRQ